MAFGQGRYLSYRLLMRWRYNRTSHIPFPLNLFFSHRRTSFPSTQRTLRPFKRFPHIRRTHTPINGHLRNPHPTRPPHTLTKIKTRKISREPFHHLRRLRQLLILPPPRRLFIDLHAYALAPRRVERQSVALGLHVANYGRLPDFLASARDGGCWAGEGHGAGGVDVAQGAGLVAAAAGGAVGRAGGVDGGWW